jgi:predicted DsbA family dithiol-disulfide isomerase
MSTPIVEMYIDPLCPWAWLSSRWLLEAEKVRPFTVVTKVFSLGEVNAENEDYREFFEVAARSLRLLVAARRAGGEAAIRAVYTELGEAHHERDLPLAEDATLRAAAQAAGLDAALVDAAINDEDGLQAEVLAEYQDAVERGAFGVPTLSVDGSPAYFGPIVDRRITGEEAGALWDIALPLLLHPHVFELKRNRTGEPDIGKVRLREAVGAATS